MDTFMMSQCIPRLSFGLLSPNPSDDSPKAYGDMLINYQGYCP
jgi:hypothetical protein